MPACKRVVMNSGKVQMTAPPQMRSGKADNMVIRFLFQSVLKFFCPCGGVLNFELFDSSRRSVIETSRSLKELFHEARERASKALGFAKMLRKVRDSSNDFTPLKQKATTVLCDPVFSAHQRTGTVCPDTHFVCFNLCRT